MARAKLDLKPSGKGEELYKQHIIGAVYAENIDKYVAFDLKTGEFLIDKDAGKAEARVAYKFPNADIWVTRITGTFMDKMKQAVLAKLHGQ